jgi:hypothetical protein
MSLQPQILGLACPGPNGLQVGTISIVGDIDIVAFDFKVLAKERLVNITNELDAEVSVHVTI